MVACGTQWPPACGRRPGRRCPSPPRSPGRSAPRCLLQREGWRQTLHLQLIRSQPQSIAPLARIVIRYSCRPHDKGKRNFQWKTSSFSWSGPELTAFRLHRLLSHWCNVCVRVCSCAGLAAECSGEPLKSLKSKIQSTCCTYVTVLPGSHHWTAVRNWEKGVIYFTSPNHHFLWWTNCLCWRTELKEIKNNKKKGSGKESCAWHWKFWETDHRLHYTHTRNWSKLMICTKTRKP